MYILEYQNNENFFVEIFSTVAMAYPLFHNGVHKFMPPTWQFSRLQTALKSLNWNIMFNEITRRTEWNMIGNTEGVKVSTYPAIPGSWMFFFGGHVLMLETQADQYLHWRKWKCWKLHFSRSHGNCVDLPSTRDPLWNFHDASAWIQLGRCRR